MTREELKVYETLGSMFGFPQQKLDQIVLYNNKVMGRTRLPNVYATIIAEYKCFDGIPYPLFSWVHEDYRSNIDKHFDKEIDGSLKPNFRLTISSCGLPELMFRGTNASIDLRAELSALKRAFEDSKVGKYVDYLALDDEDSKWFAIRFRNGELAQNTVEYLNGNFRPKTASS